MRDPDDEDIPSLVQRVLNDPNLESEWAEGAALKAAWERIPPEQLAGWRLATADCEGLFFTKLFGNRTRGTIFPAIEPTPESIKMVVTHLKAENELVKLLP